MSAINLSPNTVAKAYRVLRGRLNAAVDAGLIKQSPASLKGAATARHPETRIATPEQVLTLDRAAGPRRQALVLTAAY